MGVQFSRFSAEHIFLLTFALPCITLNSYLDIAFKNFVPVHKDKNRKIFIFLRQLNELFTICPNYRGVYMEKSKLTADIFDGQEHYRFADIDLSDYNTAFPNSLISFMYMNVSSVGNMMDGFEQRVGRLFTEKDTEVLTKCSYAAELYLESLTSHSIYFLPLELEYKPLIEKLRETQFSDYARQRISLTKIKTARRKTSLMQEQLLRLADGVFDADSSSESNLERLTTYYQVNTRSHLPYKFLPLTTTYELVDDKYFTEVLNAPDMFELINFHVCECVRQNIKMRRCKNCGKYFALTGHAGTDYCDRPFGPNGKPCRMVGASKVWAERKKSDDVFSEYRREYKKRFAHIAAGKCTQEQFLQWAAKARKEKLKCAAGIISMETYLDWLKNSK